MKQNETKQNMPTAEEQRAQIVELARTMTPEQRKMLILLLEAIVGESRGNVLLTSTKHQ